MFYKYRYFLKLILVLCVGLFSCRRTHISDNLPVIEINPQSAKEGLLSDYFDSIRYIPLQTFDTIVLGSIKKIEHADNKFYLADGISNLIYVFDN